MFYRFYLPKGLVEYCFNIETISPLNKSELLILKSLLCDGFVVKTIKKSSQLSGATEFGPRLNFETAWSSNMVSICKSVGLSKITRVERSRRLVVHESQKVQLDSYYDRMTEQIYPEPLKSFATGLKPEPLSVIPLLENGPEELKKITIAAFDDFERQLIYDYFSKAEKRNPTFAEVLDWANANSEHCRHWLFRAKWIIDGEEMPETLFQLVKKPWIENPGNTLFAFDDNSGAILGRPTQLLRPIETGKSSAFELVEATLNPTETAETHNFPTGVSPKGGAETGLGGMQRDQRDVRQGAVTTANLAGYGVGNLNLPNFKLPWEDESKPYLPNLASPLKILIEGSGGVHHYGNESGIPLTAGFVRSMDITIDQERWAFQKPILYAGGIGNISSEHIQKNEPQIGMKIIQIGGPAYRIGVGGGAASSKGQGDQALELDFNAVQRGNAEMSRKVDRVVYTCVSLGDNNPIVIAHDQGAGGMANAVKEAVGKAGGKIDIRKVNVGDPTMSVWEIYVAEYQERECFLIWPDRLDQFLAICHREKTPYEVLGEITGDGRFTVEDSFDGSTPVSLNLEAVLGDLPQKTYRDERKKTVFPKFDPSNITLKDAIWRVLHLPSVASKRYLTKNVDRSVKGLTAQQQCCGPMQLTVADCAISALSHFNTIGMAYSIGERSPTMIGNPASGARMAIAEAILNLSGTHIDEISNIGCRANWMWAPKLLNEGAAMYDAAKAMSDFMINLKINISGGKDSSSMYSRIQGQIVKSPRELAILATAITNDITKKTTPDFKKTDSFVLFLDLAKGKRRLGGSALAQVYGQLGNEFPDIEDVNFFQNGFNFVQHLLKKNLILSCHDTAGDGLFVSLVEMSISGNIGCSLNLYNPDDTLNYLFAEEAGLILEVNGFYQNVDVFNIAHSFNLHEYLRSIGETNDQQTFTINHEGNNIFKSSLNQLRFWWEETSYQLDRQRTNPKQADEEWEAVKDGIIPLNYNVSFTPKATTPKILERKIKPRVAILREEGTNGEDEMRSAFYQAGFEVCDVTMTDLLSGSINLNKFRGLAAAGGFSYADVPESAKGWAATIRFNPKLKKMFDDFYNRSDTFSLGVCNGCQLFALLGWVPWAGISDDSQPRFVQNLSQVFESRWSTVKISQSPSIMLQGMENSVLGIWTAHGEGRLLIPKKDIFQKIKKDKLIPMYYVDDKGCPTESYPFNPNGSPMGIASLCTPDGRHLAMMPHPERCFLKWQWPYLPKELDESWEASPWLKMFQNARKWCEN